MTVHTNEQELSLSREVNFDSLVGPTHNYGGLSAGNLASIKNAGQVANPRAAALQVLSKMRSMHSKGLIQGILPPHLRPHLSTLRSLGFKGSDINMLAEAGKHPALLANIASASAMWAANAATISPSADTIDNRVHITPANLMSHFHRSLECEQTSKVLNSIFQDKDHFAVHRPVLQNVEFGDEGAANHLRLSHDHGSNGVEIFIYGRRAFERINSDVPRRQVLEASQRVAIQHQLKEEHTLFLQQSATAIDAGAFHNDVVSVANENVFLLHEKTFENQKDAMRSISEACDFEPCYLQIMDDEVPLKDAVSSYLFNSQLLTLPNGTMLLLAPMEVKANPLAYACVKRLITQRNPIEDVCFIDLNQSMRNGGGPACLRLRVVMNPEQLSALSGGVILNEDQITQLEKIVNRYYRTELSFDDLQDPEFISDSFTALDEFSQCLDLGAIYDFQS